MASAGAATSNGLGIAGFVLGICSFVVPYIGILIGIVGIVLSRIGLNRSNREGAPHRKLAKAGFVLSIIGTAINVLGWILIIWLAATWDESFYIY